MPETTVRKGGKKGRKVGGGRKKPTHQRYTAEKRWIKNAARNVLREMKKHPNYGIPANTSADVKSRILVMQKAGR